MRIILINTILILISGCFQTSQEPVLDDFEKTINIKGNSSLIKSRDIGDVVDLIIFDSILVVNEAFQKKIFKYYDINTGIKIDGFINKGKGPNELSFPRLLYKLNDRIFTTYDESKKVLIYFYINDILKKKYQFGEKIEFDNVNLSIFRIYPISDTLFIILGAFEEGKYCLYNNQTKKTTLHISFPVDKRYEKISNYLKGWAHQGELAVKPDRSKFVFVCKNGYFDICSIDNNELTLKKRKVYFQSEYKTMNGAVAHSSKSKYAFRSVSSSDKFIYMIYSGRTKEESGDEYFAGNNILIYDWNGFPVCNLRTDRFLKKITVDEKNQVVYGYCTNPSTGEPEIIKYELPKM